LTPDALRALELARKHGPGIGDAPILPVPKSSKECMSRYHARALWLKGERARGLERIKGRGWRSLRRKFAPERSRIPVAGRPVDWQLRERTTGMGRQPMSESPAQSVDQAGPALI
jgi:hypothetical protein